MQSGVHLRPYDCHSSLSGIFQKDCGQAAMTATEALRGASSICKEALETLHWQQAEGPPQNEVDTHWQIKPLIHYILLPLLEIYR